MKKYGAEQPNSKNSGLSNERCSRTTGKKSDLLARTLDVECKGSERRVMIAQVAQVRNTLRIYSAFPQFSSTKGESIWSEFKGVLNGNESTL